jgi:hypothetical protein
MRPALLATLAALTLAGCISAPPEPSLAEMTPQQRARWNRSVQEFDEDMRALRRTPAAPNVTVIAPHVADYGYPRRTWR